ncbi:hypothetical protein [Polaribacter sp. SA4-12]|uniref:hypothetical protein n=1 Tax=Polaribacter sp. SA4-12 TaxID=1312072 RepID=UPI0018DF949D|nr:hypothetical protein [Polaribacter sp. SA4-12]
MKYTGKPTKGVKFYNLLYESERFCCELGKVTLASGKLEAELILYFKKHKIKDNFKKATLGKLISIGEKNNLINENFSMVLRNILIQRNELTHNIYALFIDLKDDSILEKDNLLDSDVHTYIEFIWQVRENINDVAEIVREKTVTI